jgi:threonyl-tRNA synthetase
MIVDRLRAQMIRAEMAPQSETVSKKIREGTTQKIPNLLICGEREQADGTVTLRRYGVKEQVTLSIDDFERALVETIRTRSLAFRL